MIVYNRLTGDIIAEIPDNQDVETFFVHYPTEIREKLTILKVNQTIRPLSHYKVENGEIVKRPKHEVLELQLYGKILTSEERLLNKLKPSISEVKKAKQTIEVLEIIKEVI